MAFLKNPIRIEIEEENPRNSHVFSSFNKTVVRPEFPSSVMSGSSFVSSALHTKP